MLRDFEKEKLAGHDERPDIFTNDRNASRFTRFVFILRILPVRIYRAIFIRL